MRRLVLGICTVSAIGCVDFTREPYGRASEPCYREGDCDSGLVCREGTCFEACSGDICAGRGTCTYADGVEQCLCDTNPSADPVCIDDTIYTYSIGGTISGLTGSLGIAIGSEAKTISGSSYSSSGYVSGAYTIVITQAADQRCLFSNSDAQITVTVNGTNVDDVNIHCVAMMWGTAVKINSDLGEDYPPAPNPQLQIDADGNALVVWHQYDGTSNNIWANRNTAGSGWGTATKIESDSGEAADPQLQIDADGNALAVWYQDDGTRYSIWANRYTASSGSWETATKIDSENLGNAESPQLQLDADGNALAVWHQNDGMRDNIWANRYTAGSGSWETATKIDSEDLGDASSPQVQINADGNALAVWVQFDGTSNNIWANRNTAGSGWGTATKIESDSGEEATDPQVQINADGNALAVWQQFDGMRWNIWANRYTVGSGWSTAIKIDSEDLGGATSPQVQFDADGNALAVWYQYDGTRGDIWANRYLAGSGSWGMAAKIDSEDLGNASSPRMLFDANGNALTVWHQSDGTRSNIWANRYTVGSGWSTATKIDSEDLGGAASPQMQFDADGNALVVWKQSDGTRFNIWANRYFAGSSSWGTATKLDSENLGDAYSLQVQIDTDGNALVVWRQYNSTGHYDIWANRYGD